MEQKQNAVKLYNKKLAKRIADYEKRLETLRARAGAITPEAAAGERMMQQQVNADIKLLAQHGFNKYGAKK